MVAAPAVEQLGGLAHDAYALWIFAVPQLLAALIEAPLSLAADGVARDRIIALSMGALAAALGACALSPTPWLLSLALAVAGAASGIACSAAQVALIAAQPGRAASAMTRWTAFASAGDLLTPLVVAAALALGCDHRAALIAIALVIALHALFAARTPAPSAQSAADDDAVVPLRDAFRLAARSPRLWLFLCADASCCLLDEVVVALAALRLHDDLGWSLAAAAASATALALGSLFGALLAERALERHAARAVLLVSALISLCALLWFVSAHATASVIGALALLGAAAAVHHPLTRAASYELLPGRPGLVNALTQLFVPIDVALPLAIGALAAHAGLGSALLALCAQPLAMLVVVLVMCSASPMTAAGSEAHRAINAVWRIESARLIAGLARMVRDVGLAEELAQDALVAALEHWPHSGVPDNPGAWLMATAKRRAIDHLRRDKRVERKHEEIGHDLEAQQQHAAPDLDAALDDDIGDDLLRLVFTACHPVLSTEARVALTLRLLGGLTTDEIARAFLVPESTVAQRIVRAKRTLADAGVPFEVPRGEELSLRLASVLEVVYLIFNEGYSATAGDDWMRPGLCEDALRLGRILAGLAPLEPEVHGLVALMEIQASRSRARTRPSGEPILLLDQNRAHWDQLLIRRGLAALNVAERLGGAHGFYALQAAIAACHGRARTAAETDWQRITELYGELAEVAPSPVVQLNRAVAVAMASGPAAGLELVDALMGEPALAEYHLLFGVRGDLLFKLGRFAEARTELERAAALTRNARERTLLLERAAECERLAKN